MVHRKRPEALQQPHRADLIETLRRSRDEACRAMANVVIGGPVYRQLQGFCSATDDLVEALGENRQLFHTKGASIHGRQS